MPGRSPLEVLLDLTRQLEHARGAQQRLQAALGCALEASGALLAVVVLMEPEGPRLHASRCAPPGLHPLEPAACSWLASRAVELQRPLEQEEALRLAPGPAPQAGLGTLLAVPFPLSRRPLRGALCLGTWQPRRFSLEEVDLLRLVADRLGETLDEEPARAETRFQALVDHLPDAVLVADDTGRYIEVNPAACTLLGMTREQLLGRSVFELAAVPPEHTEVLWRQFMEARVQEGEFELRTPQGRRVFVEYSARAHFVPGLHLSLLREVTQRKRAESLLSLLTEASEVLVGALEPGQVLQAVPRLAVKQLGDVCLVVLGEAGALSQVAAAHRRAEGEPLLQPLLRYRPPASRLEPLWRALQTGQEVVGRTTPEQSACLVEDAQVAEAVRALGLQAYLVVPLATRERLLGVLALFTTDPRWGFEADDRVAALELGRLAALALENARLHEGARQSLRLRQELMAMVAHDLRNPLQALSLRAQLLGRRAHRAGDTATEVDAHALRHLAHQMARLLEDLVDVARIEAGRLALQCRPQLVGGLMAEALELLVPLGQQHGVAVELRPVHGAPRVVVDRSRLLQVLSNLVGNALKFTAAGGRVVLRVEQREGQVVFSVSDTGMGISAEQLPHVFERYWRAREVGKTAGLGLGLAIVKGIVEAHGGRVWAESQPGQGSTFYFTLPLAPAGG